MCSNNRVGMQNGNMHIRNISCSACLASSIKSNFPAYEIPICLTLTFANSSINAANHLLNVFLPRPFVIGNNSPFSSSMTTRMFSTLEMTPATRLIRPPFTKLSNEEIPINNLLWFFTRSTPAKTSSRLAPDSANLAASITWNA